MRKLLKLRDLAYQFLRFDVKMGRHVISGLMIGWVKGKL